MSSREPSSNPRLSAADQAAVDAMRLLLDTVPMDGLVVIGEGERDEAPMLYIGEEVGTGKGPAVDIALDPLEGTTITAKAGPNALAVLACAEAGNLLNAPDVYMDKLAVGPGYPEGIIDLAKSPSDNVRAVAEREYHADGQEMPVVVVTLEQPVALKGLPAQSLVLAYGGYFAADMGDAPLKAVLDAAGLGAADRQVEGYWRREATREASSGYTRVRAFSVIPTDSGAVLAGCMTSDIRSAH